MEIKGNPFPGLMRRNHLFAREIKIILLLFQLSLLILGANKNKSVSYFYLTIAAQENSADATIYSPESKCECVYSFTVVNLSLLV